MRHATRALCVTALFGSGALTLPSAAAAEVTRAGVVTTLQGTATVVHAVTPRPSPLRFKDDVFLLDRITTGDQSLARILLGGKAIVTARERSVLTITEVPGAATINLVSGKIAVAVAKEKMIPGESVDIKAPNAVAGIRGTIVIAEVSQATAQKGAAPTAVTSTFTVLHGTIEVTPLDAVTGRSRALPISVGTLERVGLTGAGAPRSEKITPEKAAELAGEYKVSIREAPPIAHEALTDAHIRQALRYTAAVLRQFQRRPAAAVARRAGGDNRPRGGEEEREGRREREEERPRVEERLGELDDVKGAAVSDASQLGFGSRLSSLAAPSGITFGRLSATGISASVISHLSTSHLNTVKVIQQQLQQQLARRDADATKNATAVGRRPSRR